MLCIADVQKASSVLVAEQVELMLKKKSNPYTVGIDLYVVSTRKLLNSHIACQFYIAGTRKGDQEGLALLTQWQITNRIIAFFSFNVIITCS